MTEPDLYFTTVHPVPECECSGRRDVVPQKHVWSCPARCRAFVGGTVVGGPYVGPPAPSNTSRCALDITHEGMHESYNGERW